jgi:uncharacterized membrane protein YciS (DUF1049 family)
MDNVKIPWGLFLLAIIIAITFMNNKVNNRKKVKREKLKVAQQQIIDDLVVKNTKNDNL